MKPILTLLIFCFGLTRISFSAEAPSATPLKDKIYHFQHRLLPKWTHATSGAFYEDLKRGAIDRLREAAAEVVSKEFAAGIKVRVTADPECILIEFPTPLEPPLCYFVLLKKEGPQFAYVTLEMTEDLFGTGSKSVMGGWSAEGGHQNFGPRPYTDAERFVADAQSGKKKG